MTRPLSEQVIEKLKHAENLYHRLISSWVRKVGARLARCRRSAVAWTRAL